MAIFSGMLAGAVHVLSGPDHLAAVAPLALRPGGRAWLAGLRWGVGHSSGVLMVGLLSLMLREAFPAAWLSGWAEQLVGVVLIGIGLWGLRRAFSRHVHLHEHTHDGERHAHIHVHGHGHQPSQPGTAHRHTHAAFAVGTLHGLAGSSHFLGVLPALAFPSRWQAAAYLISYGLGTIVSMAWFSSVVGFFARRYAWHGAGPYRALMGACSVAALLVGAYWLAV